MRTVLCASLALATVGCAPSQVPGPPAAAPDSPEPAAPGPTPDAEAPAETLSCALARQLEEGRLSCEAEERTANPDFAQVFTMSIEARECAGGVGCFAVGTRSIGFTSRPPGPSPALARCMGKRFDELTAPPPKHTTQIECRHSMTPHGFASPMLTKLDQAPQDACISGKTRCWDTTTSAGP